MLLYRFQNVFWIIWVLRTPLYLTFVRGRPRDNLTSEITWHKIYRKYASILTSLRFGFSKLDLEIFYFLNFKIVLSIAHLRKLILSKIHISSHQNKKAYGLALHFVSKTFFFFFWSNGLKDFLIWRDDITTFAKTSLHEITKKNSLAKISLRKSMSLGYQISLEKCHLIFTPCVFHFLKIQSA